MAINMTFADKLKKLRKEKNISQDKLGEKIGIHGRHIGKYEKGALLPNAETLIKIAKYFKVTTDYLLFENTATNEEPDIKDKELLKKFEVLDKMEDQDKKIIISLIDAYIKKNLIEDVIQQR
jgi:transcriptional regulator with XRE-family HTH domain